MRPAPDFLPSSFWRVLLAASALALVIGIYFLSFKGILNVFLGIGTAFVLIYLLKRMIGRFLGREKPGRNLLIRAVRQFYLRFLCCAVFLLLLAYSRWLHPIGFLIGFSAVALALVVWGIGWAIKSNRGLS
jgi:uncharacterized integral membrane protein